MNSSTALSNKMAAPGTIVVKDSNALKNVLPGKPVRLPAQE
jgi:hypothetical protein